MQAAVAEVYTSPMLLTTYRIYVQEAGNPLAMPFDVECESEEDALVIASLRMPRGGWAEVWEGHDLVAIIGMRPSINPGVAG